MADQLHVLGRKKEETELLTILKGFDAALKAIDKGKTKAGIAHLKNAFAGGFQGEVMQDELFALAEKLSGSGNFGQADEALEILRQHPEASIAEEAKEEQAQLPYTMKGAFKQADLYYQAEHPNFRRAAEIYLRIVASSAFNQETKLSQQTAFKRMLYLADELEGSSLANQLLSWVQEKCDPADQCDPELKDTAATGLKKMKAFEFRRVEEPLDDLYDLATPDPGADDGFFSQIMTGNNKAFFAVVAGKIGAMIGGLLGSGVGAGAAYGITKSNNYTEDNVNKMTGVGAGVGAVSGAILGGASGAISIFASAYMLEKLNQKSVNSPSSEEEPALPSSGSIVQPSDRDNTASRVVCTRINIHNDTREIPPRPYTPPPAYDDTLPMAGTREPTYSVLLPSVDHPPRYRHPPAYEQRSETLLLQIASSNADLNLPSRDNLFQFFSSTENEEPRKIDLLEKRNEALDSQSALTLSM